MIKRVFDISAALIGLVLAAPVMLVLMLLVRRNSPGPAIFAQTRVGHLEVPFTCYKLRTMYENTGDKPTHEVGSMNVTPLGAFLRRTKLDELPQLFNVLKGELSLVGPRPCLATQAELIDARRRAGVFACRPGITGLAQIRGVDMSDPAKLALLDRDYVRSQSLLGDVRIILATVTGSGMGIDRVNGVDAAEDSKISP